MLGRRGWRLRRGRSTNKVSNSAPIAIKKGARTVSHRGTKIRIVGHREFPEVPSKSSLSLASKFGLDESISMSFDSAKGVPHGLSVR